MQVTAEVTRAEEAWAGLAAAQGVAKELIVPAPAQRARSIDRGLAHVALETSQARPDALAAGQAVAVVVQYLRN